MKKCFTLAEVLIVLGIIGVIAILTIPTLISNFQNYIKKAQINVINTKLYQASEQMQLNGYLSKKYSNTSDYVKELSRFLKIINICDSDNLEPCWGYSEITTRSDGTKYKVSDIKNAKIAFNKNNSFSDFTDSIGLILADGTPLLISYNKKCELLDSDSRYGYEKTSQCIIGIYDLNGKKNPNTFGKDVVGFNIGAFGGSCLPGVEDVCFTTSLFYAPPISKQECENLKDKLSLKYCPDNTDYYAGAAKACGGKDKLISNKQLKILGKNLYKNGKFQTNSEIGLALGIEPNPRFDIWMNEETSNPNGEYKYGKNGYFMMDQYGYQTFTQSRGNSGVYTICVE